MKLTDEQIEEKKKTFKGVTSTLEDNLFCTIEALRQENADWQKRYEELDTGNSKLFKDFCELKQELADLQKCYDVTNRSWKELVQENEQLQAQAARYREALKELQWSGVASWAMEERGCPWCHEEERYGHRMDCELAALLKIAEVEK